MSRFGNVPMMPESDPLDHVALRASRDDPQAFSPTFERHFDIVGRTATLVKPALYDHCVRGRSCRSPSRSTSTRSSKKQTSPSIDEISAIGLS